ncbi:unnamed protein product [Mucor hiemalis]
MSTSPQQMAKNNKRKFSQTSDSSLNEEDNHSTKSKEQEEEEDVSSPIPKPQTQSSRNNSNNGPPIVALPPPLMQYPNGHLVSVVHHPQQPYYQMYHPQQQQFYYPVSPQQHPFVAQQSPVLIPQPPPPPHGSSNDNSTNNAVATSATAGVHRKSTTTPRILPKNPDTATAIASSPLSSPAGALYPQPPPSPFYHPYALQMSPTMMPNYPPLPPSRHNSISSSPGLGPTSLNSSNSTADQREKARKVSHSAIERRRRERINDKILQLKQLIPSCAEQDNLHKMSILQSAIDYISYLKDIVKSLDEHGTETTTEQLLKGDHLRVKMAKSMLPKEVEPFTTQFSVNTTTNTEHLQQQDVGSTITKKNEQQQRGLKPMDVIKSGTPIVSTTPLTPPQEPTTTSNPSSDQQNSIITADHKQITSSPVLVSSLPSTPLLKPDETKHMSLQNILC